MDTAPETTARPSLSSRNWNFGTSNWISELCKSAFEVQTLKNGLFCGCAILALAGPGCSQLPTGPSRPSFDPDTSGTQAIEQYDADGDGKIDLTEAEQSPGLLVAFSRIDQDGDSALNASEIADRVRYYKTANTTIVGGGVTVFAGNRPLAGATVTFEPEEFLGEAFTPSSGETDGGGNAYLAGSDADFPGLYLGMYRVRISRMADGQETIPAQYNSETTLGYEAADDIPNVATGIQFRIGTK